MSLYSRFRIFLMTLALGMAGVNCLESFAVNRSDRPLNLPRIESNSPLIVYPIQGKITPATECKGHVCSEIFVFEKGK